MKRRCSDLRLRLRRCLSRYPLAVLPIFCSGLRRMADAQHRPVLAAESLQVPQCRNEPELTGANHDNTYF